MNKTVIDVPKIVIEKTALDNSIIVPYKENYNKIKNYIGGKDLYVKICRDPMIYPNIIEKVIKLIYVSNDEYDNNRCKLYMSNKGNTHQYIWICQEIYNDKS